MSKTMESSTYVVIGAGLAGAATAWRLAQGGHQVTLLERTTPANPDGSSQGSARIFRYAYLNPFYAGLVVRSVAGWQELAKVSGTELITTTGSVDFGPMRTPESLAKVLDSVGVENEIFSIEEATQRWPQIRFDTPVVWHQAAGVVDAQSAVKEMVKAAVGLGAQLKTDWPVASVTKTATGYLVSSAAGDQIEAERIVVSAGGWLPQLLGQLDLPSSFLQSLPRFTVRQENAFHFPYRELPPAGETWPTFIHKREDDFQAYGLPGGRDAAFRGQKVAQYSGGRVIPSAAEQTGQIDPDNRERLIQYVTATLPGLEPTPYAEATCLFTSTLNEDFVIDRCENVTVLSPCSGHGAKFAPLIGQYAAELAESADPTVGEKLFKPSLA